jgi:hypothetical protein
MFNKKLVALHLNGMIFSFTLVKKYYERYYEKEI